MLLQSSSTSTLSQQLSQTTMLQYPEKIANHQCAGLEVNLLADAIQQQMASSASCLCPEALDCKHRQLMLAFLFLCCTLWCLLLSVFSLCAFAGACKRMPVRPKKKKKFGGACLPDFNGASPVELNMGLLPLLRLGGLQSLVAAASSSSNFERAPKSAAKESSTTPTPAPGPRWKVVTKQKKPEDVKQLREGPSLQPDKLQPQGFNAKAVVVFALVHFQKRGRRRRSCPPLCRWPC